MNFNSFFQIFLCVIHTSLMSKCCEENNDAFAFLFSFWVGINLTSLMCPINYRSGTSIPASSNIAFSSSNIKSALSLFFTVTPSVRRQSLLPYRLTKSFGLSALCSIITFAVFYLEGWMPKLTYRLKKKWRNFVRAGLNSLINLLLMWSIPGTFLISKLLMILSISFILMNSSGSSLDFKGCVRYIFASLFFMSREHLREHLWNKEECFLFHLESSFRSWDNQILTFQIFKCHDVIKCPSMKHETHFTE